MTENTEKPDHSGRAGSYVAYEIQYKKRGEEKWKKLPINTRAHDGVPGDRGLMGINYSIDLLSYEQAMALAWRYKAEKAHELEWPQVRLLPHEVSFEIKAREMPDKAEPLLGEHEE